MILAVAIVTSLTIDLGPWVREEAENRGRGYLKRPLHIGRISFRLFTGKFLLEDVVIEGRTSDSVPFLTARRIDLAIPWSTLFDRRFVIQSIDLHGWKAFIEVVDGKSSMPKLTPDRRDPPSQSNWTTTTEWVRAWDGEFEYKDHGTPWGVVARNLEVIVARPGSEYRGQATFSNGTVSIQDYLPFRVDMKSSFKLDGSRVVLDRIDLITDGAKSIVRGDVNFAHWPEQMFRVESEIDFERMRQIFFARE